MASDLGKVLAVRVSFMDVLDYREELRSAATSSVVPDLLLVGNTGQEASGPLGGLPVGNVRLQNLARHTQGFQTGSHGDGYDVNSVGVWLGVVEASAGESMTLYLYTQGPNGSLGEQLYTLQPALNSFVEGAVNFFEAPSGAALYPDTNYLLALTATGDFGGDFRVQVTESDAEDDEELDWEIEDAWRLNGEKVSWGDAWMIRVGGSPRSSPVPNHPATGRVEVTGRAQAGQTLTASVPDVADPVDGLGNPSYTYQWFRVSAGVDSVIAGATGPTYPLESADIGSQVKAEASFMDNRDNAEVLSSGAYPPEGRVRGRSNADLGSLSVDGVEELYVTQDGSFYVSLSGITSATESVMLRFALAQAEASCQVKYSQDDLQGNAALGSATELLGRAACTGTGEQVVNVTLDPGDNYVAVIVRAEAGNQKRFIVALYREEEPDYTLLEEGQTYQGVRYSFPEASPEAMIRIVLSGDATVEEDYVLYSLEGSTPTSLTGSSYTVPLLSGGYVDLRAEAVDDAEMEGDEVFMVTLRWDGPAQLQGSGVGGRSASTEYAITDNDAAVEVSFGAGSYEAFEGGTPAEVLVNLSVPSPRSLTIPLSVSNGPGSEGRGIFRVDTGSAQFSPGQTSATVTVTDGDDEVDDDMESVALRFGSLPAGVTAVEPITATVTLTDDDDPEVTVSYDMSSYEVREDGLTSAEVTVELSADPEREVVIEITATDQDGASDQDYTGVPASVTFTAGGSLMQSFTVTAVDDDIDDDGESVLLGFGMPDGVSAGLIPEAVVALPDDGDERGLTLSRGNNLSLTETNVPVTETYTVVLDSQPTAMVTVNLVVAGADGLTTLPAVTPARLEFTAGDWDLPQTMTVTVEADGDAEDESATVTHEVSGGDYGASENETLTVDVVDDDTDSSEVTLTADRASIREDAGPTPVVVTATLDEGAFKEAQLMMVSVLLGADTEAADFVEVRTFMLTIPAQMTSGTAMFMLTPVVDNLWEPETESVALGGSIQGSFRIVHETEIELESDDAEPVLSFTGPSEMREAGGSAELMVAITNGVGFETAQSVALDFDAGTPQVGRATRGTDYTVSPPGNALTLGAGVVSASATVTVTAMDDDVDEDGGLADGSDDESVVVSATHGSTLLGTVEVVILDDDDPEVTVSYDMSRYEVNEAGETSAVVRVSVSANPEREIVVGLTRVLGAGTSATDYTTNLSSSVTFSVSDHAARNFTVSAAEDDIDDDGETVLLGFANLPPEVLGGSTATVAIEDNDERGVDVSPSSVTVREEGEGNYEVMLLSEPTGAVTVSVSSDNVDVTVSPSSLEFATSNWAVAQTVTVSVGMDADAESETATLAHAASGADYAGETAAVSVTVNDNDAASTGVVLSVVPTDVGEGAGATEVAVTAELDGAAFLGATTVSVSVAPGTAVAGDYGASPASFEIVILANDDSANGTFTLTPVDDAVDEDDETVSVTGTASSLMMSSATVTIEDDDTRGVSVSATLVELNEDAGASSSEVYTVALESAPTDAVTVTVSSGDAALATVSPSSLTFTPVNWETARTVTVRAESDVNASDGSTQVTHVVSGADYGANGVTAAPVTVSVSDDDTASSRVTLSVAPGVVGEGGGGQPVVVTAQLNVSPFAQATTVSVSVSGGTAVAGDYTASPASLMIVIQPDARSASGTFTLTPVDDMVDEGGETVSVTGTASGLTVSAVTVTIEDDDMRGVSVSPTQLSLTEGERRSYAVVLESEPTGVVTVGVAVPGGVGISVLPTQLVFTASDWSEAQAVTVISGSDADANDESGTVSHAVSGADYGANGVTAAAVDVRVTDSNDPSSEVRLSVSPSEVSESSGAVTVTVTGRLDKAPRTMATEVMLTVEEATALAADYTASSGVVLTIEAFRAEGTAVVTVTPVDDAEDEDDETLTVSGTAPGLSVVAATVTLEDDDTRGVAVLANNALVTVSEGGTETYTVALLSSPVGTVTVAVTVRGDLAGNTDVTVQPSSLVFTAGDWSVAQTVTVSAAADADAAFDLAELTHAVSGADYGANGVTAESLRVFVVDTDMRGVEVSESSVTVPEGETEAYTVALSSSPVGAGTVTVAVSSDNAAVTVSPSSLAFTAGNWRVAQTVTVRAAQDVDTQDDAAVLAHAVSGSDYGPNGVTAAPVSVTVEDDDKPATEIRLSLTPSVVSEGAGPAELSVSGRLNGAARALDTEVTLTVAPGPSHAAVTATLRIPAGLMSGTVVLPLTPVDNDVDGEDVVVAVTAATGSGLQLVGVLAVTIEDDDTRGVTVLPTELEVREGGSESYEVTLMSEPTGAVTVSVLGLVSGSGSVPMLGMVQTDNGDVTVLPSSLEFTPVNWGVPQTVTVEVADDGDAEPEADVVVELTHAVSGADYGANGVAAEPVEVLVPGFEDVNGVLQVQVPEDGVVTVSEGTSAPAGVEVRLPQDLPESEVFVQTVAEEELPEQPRGFRVEDDVAVDIKLVDEDGMNLPLGEGERAVVCLPSESRGRRVYRYDGPDQGWVALDEPSEGSPEGLVCGVTDHFSLFALGAGDSAVEQAWLARFGRTVAAQVTGAISERLAAGSSSGSQWTLGRLASWDGREILSGSSFRYSLSEGSEPGWTMWGRGAYTDFEGEESSEVELDGEVVTGTVGVDFERGRWLAGLAVSHSEGDGESSEEREMDLSLTGAHPYLRVAVTERLSLWGTVGYGEGELERTDKRKVDLEMRQGAAGLRGQLTSWGSVDLALKSEVLVAKLEAEGEAEIEADASQARLMLEGVGYCELASGGRLEPSGEIGARYDGGDAEEGVGMEVGAGLRYASAHGRLTADGSVRGLLTHEESDYDEWGVSGALRLAPERSGRGLSLQLDSSYGAMASRAAEWWRQDGAGLGEAGAVSGARFEAELAYGLNAANGRGVLVPYAGFRRQAGESAWRWGSRLAVGESLSLRLEGTLRQREDTRDEHALELRVSGRW